MGRYVRIVSASIGVTLLILCLEGLWRPALVNPQGLPVSNVIIESHSTSILQQPDVALVVASQLKDNTTWLDHTLPSWTKNVYTTDGAGGLHVQANKGRESMVYLTYIIDNYDHLPMLMVFLHANRYQWHNDDPLYDGKRMLSRLQLPFVQAQGYVNLRCVWTLGCPSEIKPLEEAAQAADDVQSSDARAGSYFKTAFEDLFPNQAVPEVVGASCCAQFAVTADTIRQRPRTDYERYRNWLLQTPLPDDLSGRIMEYLWHIIFGKDPVFCPNAGECYCKVYGLCNLHCEEDGICRSQYTLPDISTMPNRWPEYGWKGEWRNISHLRAVQENDYCPK